MRYRIIMLLILLFSFVACQPKQNELTELQRQEIADKIKQLNKEMWTHWDQNDPELFIPYYSDSEANPWVGDSVMVINRLNILASSYEDVEKIITDILSRRSTQHTKIKKEYVAVLSAKHCLHVCEADFSITNEEGNESPVRPAIYTSVWSNEDGEWKILYQNFSWSPIVEK